MALFDGANGAEFHGWACGCTGNELFHDGCGGDEPGSTAAEPKLLLLKLLLLKLLLNDVAADGCNG